MSFSLTELTHHVCEAIFLIDNIYVNCMEQKEKKKSDLERLYDQWEENDDDELEEDELPPYKRKIQQPNLDKIMKQVCISIIVASSSSQQFFSGVNF
ncbi:unnamed protein product [Wuchereria bancrofti]|uniref:Uncharacterized protein n=1 Tax=Wuchereria bancrofti TaxID=6293 RepID=A0A3P7DRW2_WUCBA|nr:unnamed protein product [Wuchereria bancrofti]